MEQGVFEDESDEEENEEESDAEDENSSESKFDSYDPYSMYWTSLPFFQIESLPFYCIPKYFLYNTICILQFIG